MANNVFTLNPAGLHDPSTSGYSHIAFVPAESDVAYISGQYASGRDPAVTATDFSGQVKQAFRNLCVAIGATGGHPEGVAKLTAYIVDHSRGKAFRIRRGVVPGVRQASAFDHVGARTKAGKGGHAV